MIGLAQAARVEAMRLARNQVRHQLCAAGIKVNYIEVSEITRLAKTCFAEHRAELMDRALRNVLRWQLRQRCAKLSGDARFTNTLFSRTFAVHISGSKKKDQIK